MNNSIRLANASLFFFLQKIQNEVRDTNISFYRKEIITMKNEKVTMYCELVWTFSAKLPKAVKKYCRKEFLKLRSELVNILNDGVIDKLNQEFNSTHKWHDGIYFDSEYMKHMVKGQQVYADLINRKHLFSLVKLYITDESDIAGIFKPTNTLINIGMINLREEP